VAAAAPPPPPAYALTLAPAFAFVAPGQGSTSFLIVNTGQPVQIVVTTSDSWVAPSTKTFALATNERREIAALVQVPAGHDEGDHETQVAFAVAPPPGAVGTILITRALASRVVIATGGSIVRGLHVYGLAVPAIADSFESPTVNLTVTNAGNVHEIVDIAPFGQVLVLRDSSKVLSLTWAQHPFIGMGHITAGGSTATTLFLPWHIALGLLGLLCGVALSLSVRRSRTKEVQP
jgi:hypothetical protein